MTKETFKRRYKQKLTSLTGKSLEDSSVADNYLALASLVRDVINDKWVQTNTTKRNKGSRQVYYFSLEFFMGKFLMSNLISLDMLDTCRAGLFELGVDLDELTETEIDSGLGNGGLGRLAACFLDSIASLNLFGNGCGIRYKYGLFTQKIIDGYQVELPDNWLREINAWEIRKPDKAVVVRFNGHVETELDPQGRLIFTTKDYIPVLAVPYDMPVLGYRSDTVNTLRLWSAEAIEDYFDFSSFSRGDYLNAIASRYLIESISEVLYPDDSNYKNRQLRLKQQYFFVSAGLQSILRYYKKYNSDIMGLRNNVVVQINDTHPSLAVPELMRLLIDEEGLDWDKAWEQTTHIIAYTNHTIMPEAMECWPIETIRELLPRVYMIIEEINHRFCNELRQAYPNDPGRASRMAIIADGKVRMAYLAVAGSFSVNGVSAIHTELLKNKVLKDFYDYSPPKFNNKTNGITHRRWLLESNPGLSGLLTETIGNEWIQEPLRLRLFLKFRNDARVQEQLENIKRQNKVLFSDYIKNQTGIIVDPDSIFDCQIKRIHAYKRQLLNALHILHLYNLLSDNPNLTYTPRTFIFAGKAAPSYYFAKNVIKFIVELSKLIQSNPSVNKKINLIFLENYGISMAEHLIPATDISEQISTASTEASGTSNMKFMMNGAITLGTADGANIEIFEQVGDGNYIQFGMDVAQVQSIYASGGYNSYELVNSDRRLKRLIDQLDGSIFPNLPRDEFKGITRSLLDYNDEFFVLRDFDSYANAHDRVQELYQNRNAWNAMSIQNIATSGVFSSDNTVVGYAEDIWRIKPN